MGNDWELREYPETRTLSERLLGRLSGEVRSIFSQDIQQTQLTPPDPLSAEIYKLRDEISILQSMNDPLDVYARLPFNLKID